MKFPAPYGHVLNKKKKYFLAHCQTSNILNCNILYILPRLTFLILFFGMLPKKLYPIYSSPPLIRPPYLRTNCGHIREVAFGEREKSIDFIVDRTENSGLIRGVASRESGL